MKALSNDTNTNQSRNDGNYLVSIESFDDKGKLLITCTGFVVTKKQILTRATCVNGAHVLMLRFGALCGNNKTIRTVSHHKIVKHHMFNKKVFNFHDIAQILLHEKQELKLDKREIDKIRMIKKVSVIPSSKVVSFSEWDDCGHNRIVEMKTISADECRRFYKGIEFDPKISFCLDSNTSATDKIQDHVTGLDFKGDSL